jgi:flagellar biosynthesis/type III secretory pathway chaperone
MTSEQEEKLAILKWSLLANLTRVRQARSKEDRDRAIAEHVNAYIAEVGNDGELADAFLTWVERF